LDLTAATIYTKSKVGRVEAVEGAILGAFGPLGFIVEVLLPPVKSEGPAR